MYCKNCGKQMPDNTNFCADCGTQQNTNAMQQNNNNINTLKCSHCGSNNVNIQVVNENKLVTKHHGILWWLLIGWWWIFVKWICLFVPALLAAIFIGKRKKIKNITRKVAVCQSCGNNWHI